MSNTRRPKQVDLGSDIQLWDEFVLEAIPDVPPWQKRLPDGTVLVVDCPTSDQLDVLGAAQTTGDVRAMLTAIFAEHTDQIMALTGQQPFTVRLKLINDVMFHYGMSLANLPESSASSD